MLKKIFDSISKSSKYYLVSNLYEKITSILFFIILAKLFSTEDYGKIVLVFTVSNIGLILLNFGLPPYLQREVAIKNDNKVFFTILFIKILFIFPFFIFVFLYFNSTNIEIWYILIISGAALLLDFVNIINHYFFGKDRFDITFFSITLSRTFLIFLGILFWYFDKTLIYFVSIYLITALIQFFFLSLKLNKTEIQISFPRNFFLNSKKILTISFALGIATISNFLYDKIDIVLIDNFIGKNGVAQYNVAYSFYKLSGLLFGMILVPSFNVFSKQNRNTPIINNEFLRICKNTFFIAAFLFVIFYFFGSPVISLIFGDKYVEAEKIFPVLSFAVVGLGLNNFTGIYLNSKAEFKKVMFSALIAIIVNIFFNILFIPVWGIIAAVYSSIITEYVILSIQVYFIFQISRKSK